MPKTTRATGPSKADGTQQAPHLDLAAGSEIELAGEDSSVLLAGDLTVGGFMSRQASVWMPQGPRWGGQIQPKLRQAAAGLALARLNVQGDSQTLGQYATNWRKYGWVGLVRYVLQTLFGDGGYGYINHGSIAGANPGGAQVTTTGAWTDETGEGAITRGAYRPTTPGNGATITFPFRGSTLKIWYRADPSFGTWDYKIGSGSFVPFAMNGAAAITAVTLTGQSTVDSTVTVRATSGDGRSLGVSSYNASGVVIDNVSYGSTLLTQLSARTTGPAPSDIAMDTLGWHSLVTVSQPCDLAMLALGIGDALLDTDDATFDPALWDALAMFGNASANAGPNAATPPDLIVIGQHQGNADLQLGPGFSQWERDWLFIHSQLRECAATIGAPFIDIWADGKRSYGYWDSLGYWFVNGGGVHDDVHPSNAGHRRYAELVLSVILWGMGYDARIPRLLDQAMVA